MNLPEQFQHKLQILLGEEYEDYLSAFEESYGQTLRLNRLKSKPADFIRRFALEEVPWCENGYYYQGEERLSLHPYYYAGVFYLQEPSAMAPAHFLPVEPGDRVLDLCAAPGGKTTALAAKLQGKGLIVANDISASRCKPLLKNIEMAGVRNVMITCETPEKLAKYFKGYFDKILVDAPCSGEGMFRKEPTMAKEWSEEEVQRYSSIQKEILSYAAAMLKPGGQLMYSTCTYSPEENECSVEFLLQEYPEFTIEELPLVPGVAEGMPEYTESGSEDFKRCRRFWNHRLKGEGQFAALLKKASSSEKEKEKKISRKSKLPEELKKFISDLSIEIDLNHIMIKEERVYLLPEGLPDTKGIRFIRTGLYLGDCKKKRFEPSQALAMALKINDYANVLSLPLEDERVDRYLKCETIHAETKDGWTLVCVDDYPLGWAKSQRGILKNKYYKGWRKQ